MLKIYNIKDKMEYIKEVAELTQKEWRSESNSIEEFNNKVDKKIYKIISNFDNKYYCKLILLDNEKFGAKYIEKLENGEKLYCFEL